MRYIRLEKAYTSGDVQVSWVKSVKSDNKENYRNTGGLNTFKVASLKSLGRDLLLLGSYTRLSCTLIKWNLSGREGT